MFQVLIFILGVIAGIFYSKRAKQVPQLKTINGNSEQLELEGEIK
jgi:hypothetical protein